MRSTPDATRARWGWYLLLLVPFIATLWVPFYASGPDFVGIPYFYWYQFLWILISAALTALVYFQTREPEGALTDGGPSPVEGYK